MSQTCSIIAKIDGRFHGVYCHSDGSVAGVGACLVANYADQASVAGLISLGKLSRIGDNLEECFAYGRDRGEVGAQAKVADAWVAAAHKDFSGVVPMCFVWIDGDWFVSLGGEAPLILMCPVVKG